MTIFKSLIRLSVIYILRFIIHIFHIAPVKKGRIIFNSYRGLEYSCSPKYFSEYIESMKSADIEIIWAFRNPSNYQFLTDRGIKVVGFSSLKRIYYEATAEFSINNVGSFSWIPLRKGQEHINTWHGGGCYKRVSLGESKNNRLFLKSLMMTAQETTCFLSSSTYFSDVIIPEDFGYHGKILNTGLPRNDLFFKETDLKTVKQICSKFRIPEGNAIVLYAPTWRYDLKEQIKIPDMKRLKQSAEARYKRPCSILFRAHANLKAEIKGDFTDVSSYPDMQELLLISDMLITDYSSCMWDFSLTYKPCILFTPDLDKFRQERGFVVEIEDWGFPVCKNDETLEKIIKEVSDEEFKILLNRHHMKLGSYEKGNASEKLCHIIMQERKT